MAWGQAWWLGLRLGGAFFGGVGSAAVGKLRAAILAEAERETESPGAGQRLAAIAQLERSLTVEDG